MEILIGQQSEILSGLKCAYCKVDLGTMMRNSPNGLTLDRIDDDEPHIHGQADMIRSIYSPTGQL